MAAALEPLILEITLTLDDRVAFSLYVLKRPPLSHMRLRREIITVAMTPFYMLLGVLLAWVLDSERESLSLFFLHLVTSDAVDSVKYVIGAYVVMTACVLLARLNSRRRIRAALSRTLKLQSEVDSSDPDLKKRVTASLGQDGISTETLNGSSMLKWSGVLRLDETEAYFYLFLQPLRAFIVPKRDLRPGQAEQLRALVQGCLHDP